MPNNSRCTTESTSTFVSSDHKSSHPFGVARPSTEGTSLSIFEYDHGIVRPNSSEDDVLSHFSDQVKRALAPSVTDMLEGIGLGAREFSRALVPFHDLDGLRAASSTTLEELVEQYRNTGYNQ